MESEFITIINETTISLDIEKPPPAEDMYYCRLRLQNHNKQLEAVCLNKVVVGCKYFFKNNITLISFNQNVIINVIYKIQFI